MFQQQTVAAALRTAETAAHPLIIALFAMLLAAAIVPLLLVEIPPLGDYPAYLARLHRLMRQDDGWTPVPGLLPDLLGLGLGHLLGVIMAGKLLLVAALVLTMTGIAALHIAQAERITLGPLAALPLVYNIAVLSGQIAFLIGLGLALWGLAAWTFLRRVPLVPRTAAICRTLPAAFAVLIYLSDACALAVYGLALLCLERTRVLTGLRLKREPPPPERIVIRFRLFFESPRPPVSNGWKPADRPAVQGKGKSPLTEALPVLVTLGLVPVLLIAGTLPGVGTARSAAGSTVAGLDWLRGSFNPFIDAAVGTLMAGGMIAMVWRRALHLPEAARWLATGGLAILALLSVMPGSWHAAGRLPLGVMLVLVALVCWRLHTRTERALFVALIAVMTLVRITDVDAAFRRLEPVLADMRLTLERIAPSRPLLIAETDDTRGKQSFERRIGLRWMPALAVIDRDSRISLTGHPALIGLHAPLGRQGPVAPPDVPWSRWAEDYDHLLVLYGQAPQFAERLHPVHEASDFSLYRIR